MTHGVFAVYDSRLGAFFPPFLCANAAIAKRGFMTSATDPESQLYHHPADFTLFEVASWDDERGIYDNITPHINHGLAANYRSKPQ